MAEKRKALSKRVRFEVLKRDDFQCRYCGARAPDVALEVDHIDPVSGGGSDDFLNLVTACEDCNRGKSNIPLSELQALQSSIAEIEAIEGRAADLQELRARRQEADELLELEISTIAEAILGHTGFTPNDSDREAIKKWLKAEPIEAIMSAVDGAAESYLREPIRNADVNHYMKQIPAVMAHKRKYGAKSEAFRRIAYAAGIMRRRDNEGDLENWEPTAFIQVTEELFEVCSVAEAEYYADKIIELAKDVDDYFALEEAINVTTREHSDGER